MGIQKQALGGPLTELSSRAASRLGTACWLVSLTFVVAVGSMNLAPPHASADLIAANVTSGASILLSLVVFALSRRLRDAPLRLERVALAYQVLIGLGISLTELLITYDASSVVRGISWVCLWIVLFPLVVPSSPSRAMWGALGAAMMGPLAILIAGLSGLPLADPQTLVFLVLPNFFAAGLAMALHRILLRLRVDATRARELGAYRLERRLGGGGMGEVWRASHRMLARPAAIKLIRREEYAAGQTQNDRELVARFEREAQATAALTSAHTVHIYDFGLTDDGSLYYAMELLEGRDLQQLVHEAGRLDPRRAAHFLRQACESLAEAHGTGLVHRDVKPANLFASRLGAEVDFLKVLDFGLVSWRDEGRATEGAEGSLSGTPAYVAPELVRGEPADARADVYALGCVTYFLLTGHTVFEGDNAVAVLHAHVHEAPRPPSSRGAGDVPPAFEALVMRCLEKDPSRRPADALELRAALDVATVERWPQEEAQRWWASHPVPTRSEPPSNVALLTTFPAALRFSEDDESVR